MTRTAPNVYRYKTEQGPRYAVRVVIGDKRIRAKGFVTAQQAKDHLLEIQVGKVDAKYFPDRIPAPTLADYAPIWIKNCELRGLRSNTLRSYIQNLNDHVLPDLGSQSLDALTRQDVIALLRKKQGEDYSGNSIRLMIAPLSRLCSDAIDEGLIQHNPCLRPGRILPLRKRKREPVAITIKERDALFKAYEQYRPDFYAMTATLFLAGVRIGEALALERSDVRASQSVLLVRGTYGRGERQDTTKNRRYRRVECDPPLVACLTQHLDRVQTQYPTKTVLFPNSEGNYLHERNWQRRVWDPMLVKAGVRRITPHEARHTYATHMLEAGKSLQWVSAQLGHSSIQITVDTYGHLAQRVR